MRTVLLKSRTVLRSRDPPSRGNMGKFILCVSQHITNNVLRYVHRLKMLKNPNFATNTGWKNWKISFLLKTPVHFPEVQTPWNLNFRMNPAPQPRKPPRLFCQRNVIFGQHGFIWSWHIRDMSTYMSTSITLSMITKKNQSYVLRVRLDQDWFFGIMTIVNFEKVDKLWVLLNWIFIHWLTEICTQIWNVEGSDQTKTLLACCLLVGCPVRTYNVLTQTLLVRIEQPTSKQQATNVPKTYQKPKNTIVQNLVFQCPSRIF